MLKLNNSQRSAVSGQQKGFSLLEIVIALAIVTIGIVGVMIIFPAGLRAQQRAADFTTAAILGSQRIQEIAAQGLGDPPSRPANEGGGFPDHPGWGWEASFDYDPWPLVRVTVRVYWNEGENEKNFITFMAP